MNDLRTLQHAFWSAVRTTTIENEALFRSRGALGGAQRLEVYRTSYWVRQLSAMRSLFPSVVAAMGDAEFARTASRFIAESVCDHWAIEARGAAFSMWLAPAERVLAQVAQVDWLRFQVFVAPGAEALNAERIQQRGLFNTVLTLGPHVLHAPVGPESTQLLGLGYAEDSQLAVWRSGFEVRQTLVSEAEAEAMRAAERSTDFVTWCSLMTRNGAAAVTADALAQHLHLWLQRGWLIDGAR